MKTVHTHSCTFGQGSILVCVPLMAQRTCAKRLQTINREELEPLLSGYCIQLSCKLNNSLYGFASMLKHFLQLTTLMNANARDGIDKFKDSLL